SQHRAIALHLVLRRRPHALLWPHHPRPGHRRVLAPRRNRPRQPSPRLLVGPPHDRLRSLLHPPLPPRQRLILYSHRASIDQGATMSKQMTMGVLVGNRGFFPSHLATSGRVEIIAALEAAGIKPIVLTPEVTAHGAVETYEDAKKCAALFKSHAAEIDGLIITLPNFGEERGLADAIRLADLRVPVLIQATPDNPAKMSI